MTRCAHPDGCQRPAEGYYRLFPDRTQRLLCRQHVVSLQAMGLHVFPVTTGWQARALAGTLPPRATYR